MPDPKHQRSHYSHLDSIEPDLWTRISSLFKSSVGTVWISGQPIDVTLDEPIDVNILSVLPDPLPVDGSGVTQPVSGTVSISGQPIEVIGSDPSATPVTILDTHEALVFSLVTGFTSYSKFGYNPVININDTEDIWSVGGTRAWLSTATALEILSSSGSDDVGSSGATKVTIQGLDNNWDFAEATVSMDGVTPVALPGTWFRINRMFVAEVGTYAGNNVGNITLRIPGPGATQANIRATVGQTEQTHFSCPRNTTAALQTLYISTDSTKVINGTVWQNSNIDDVATPFGGAKRKVFGVTGLKGSMDHAYEAHPVLTGPCDIWWTATSFANGTEVEAGFDLLLKVD